MVDYSEEDQHTGLVETKKQTNVVWVTSLNVNTQKVEELIKHTFATFAGIFLNICVETVQIVNLNSNTGRLL